MSSPTARHHPTRPALRITPPSGKHASSETSGLNSLVAAASSSGSDSSSVSRSRPRSGESTSPRSNSTTGSNDRRSLSPSPDSEMRRSDNSSSGTDRSSSTPAMPRPTLAAMAATAVAAGMQPLNPQQLQQNQQQLQQNQMQHFQQLQQLQQLQQQLQLQQLQQQMLMSSFQPLASMSPLMGMPFHLQPQPTPSSVAQPHGVKRKPTGSDGPRPSKQARQSHSQHARPRQQRAKRRELGNLLLELRHLSQPDCDRAVPVGRGDRSTNSKEGILRVAKKYVLARKAEIAELEAELAALQAAPSAPAAAAVAAAAAAPTSNTPGITHSNFFHLSACPLVVLDASGAITDFNRNVPPMFGLTSEQFAEKLAAGAQLWSLLGQGSAQRLQEGVAKLQRGSASPLVNLPKLLSSAANGVQYEFDAFAWQTKAACGKQLVQVALHVTACKSNQGRA